MKKTKHIGNLRINKENESDFSHLTEVTGYVSVSGSAKLDAPKLETVGGYVNVFGSSKFDALETVGGSVDVYGSAKLDAPKLETVGGYVDVSGSANLDALEIVGGSVDVSGSAKLDAPKLETVGGYVNVSGFAKFDAPKLETVGGYVHVFGSANLDALETVGYSVSVSGSAKLDAPKLETVGGSVDVYGSAKLDAPKLNKKNDPNAAGICSKALQTSFKLKGLMKIDGILSWFISKRKKNDLTIFKIKVVGSLKTSFAVQRGEQYSHGETIEKAIEDLKYKCSDRDASEFEKWKHNMNKRVSFEDAVASYRTITGACEYGVKEFVKSINIPKKITPNVIIELTKNQYGHDKFVTFFK